MVDLPRAEGLHLAVPAGKVQFPSPSPAPAVCVGQQPFFQFRLRSGCAVLAELPAAQPSPPSCSSSILSIVLRAGSDCASDSVQNYSAVSSGSYSDDM